MSAPTKLAQKLNSLADLWVKDPFRPNIQLQTFLKSLSTHPRLTPQAVQAARALKDNGAQKQYTLSKRTLQPASMPQHYDRLIEGYHKSIQGIGRPVEDLLWHLVVDSRIHDTSGFRSL